MITRDEFDKELRGVWVRSFISQRARGIAKEQCEGLANEAVESYRTRWESKSDVRDD